MRSALIANGSFSYTYVLTIFLFDYQSLYQHGVYALWAAPLYFRFSSCARTPVSAAGLQAPFSLFHPLLALDYDNTMTKDRGGVA